MHQAHHAVQGAADWVNIAKAAGAFAEAVIRKWNRTMLLCAIALLAIAMSVGLAEARMHKRMVPGCMEGKQAAARCACGTVAGRPLVCQRGQWCSFIVYLESRLRRLVWPLHWRFNELRIEKWEFTLHASSRAQRLATFR